MIDTNQLRHDFEHEGLIACLDIMTPPRAARFSSALEAFVNDHQDNPSFPDWVYGKTHLLLAWVVELAAENVLLDAVEALIGPNILLWDSSIPIKPPHSSGYFGWHQDATYWPIEPLERVVSAWVALGHVTPLNGGMQMIPGSHHLGRLPHRKTFDEESMLRRGQQLSECVDDSNAIDIYLRPGQASLHHTFMLHGSGANQTDTWRLGVILNFVAADVGPVSGHQDSAMLMRGSGDSTRFALERRPDSDLSASALRRYREAVARASTRYRDVSPGQ